MLYLLYMARVSLHFFHLRSADSSSAAVVSASSVQIKAAATAVFFVALVVAGNLSGKWAVSGRGTPCAACGCAARLRASTEGRAAQRLLICRFERNTRPAASGLQPSACMSLCFRPPLTTARRSRWMHCW